MNIEIILKKIEPYVEDFKKLILDEPSTENSIKILEGIQKLYEDYHNVQFDHDCFEEAVNFQKNIYLIQKLPDKAIDIIR